MTNLNYTNTTTTTASDKLDSKLRNWVTKIEEGNSDYFAVTVSKGQLLYVSGKSAVELISFRMLIDKGNGLEMVHFHNGTSPTDTSPFTLIVKKDQHLIVNDNGDIRGFCVKDIEPTAKILFIETQTPYSHLFIAASDKANSVEVFHALNSSPTPSTDPITHCMDAIFSSVEKPHSKEVV